ncbi:uncharacterized protein ColSpa_09319 [Colletotrichum spaethianum]|uniref:Uncharacterized protein n=1 Tax=Colletotrichum spaethianum TaxID=700344 RepID=A0AA37PBE8_9PEZI|nr:uncharacterized protein ColSpa_09319 [Colletotrichum spaethianum]GKT49138.1 hypothetical protein ColSpa_09319 [Colletotrichum spaethianum]
MSVLLYIQEELRKTFVHQEGFKSLQRGDRPCTVCVGSLHRHIFLQCCSSEIGELCVVCKEEGKECRAIPKELLGVAQSLWNHAKDIAAKDTDEDKGLNELQRWRLHYALQRACMAWNELLEFVDQPVELDGASLEAVKIQEAIIAREISTIGLLRDADIIKTPKELRARLAALAPPWSRHAKPARKLREAVAEIPLAENVPAPGVAEEGVFANFPQLMAAVVVEKLIEFSGNTVPVYVTRYPGVRLRICDGGERREKSGRGSLGGNDPIGTREAGGKVARAGTNEPSDPKGGGRQNNADDEHPVDPNHDPEPEPDDAAGPPEALAKPKRARPADRNPAKRAATAKKAPVSLATAKGAKAAPKSGKKPDKSNDDGEDDNDDGDGDGDGGGGEDNRDAKTGPVTRSQRKRPAPDEDADKDEPKPRKRTRAQGKSAAGR